MERNKYFVLEASANRPNKYLIRPVHDNLPLYNTSGSYALLPARLMGLSWAEYLRFCRDVLGAEINGKSTYYPIPYFDKNIIVAEFVNLLNTRAKFILYVQAHPDYEIKKNEIEKLKKEIKNKFKIVNRNE